MDNVDAQRYMELMQKELENEKLRRLHYENESANNSSFQSKEDQNLVEYQLDLKEELDRIYHLLSGHVISIDKDGNEFWDNPKDDRMKIFSEYGVKQIMNIISFYVNRNTLMSFYDSETINWKIRDFGIEISDLIFNRYEAFFYYPTPEDLFDIYLNISKKHGLAFTEDELYQKCVQWSREELQNKLRHYPMMILSLIDTVHSTYLRALGGKERQSLRERLNISQNANQFQDMNQSSTQRKFSILRPRTW